MGGHQAVVRQHHGVDERQPGVGEINRLKCVCPATPGIFHTRETPLFGKTFSHNLVPLSNTGPSSRPVVLCKGGEQVDAEVRGLQLLAHSGDAVNLQVAERGGLKGTDVGAK